MAGSKDKGLRQGAKTKSYDKVLTQRTKQTRRAKIKGYGNVLRQEAKTGTIILA